MTAAGRITAIFANEKSALNIPLEDLWQPDWRAQFIGRRQRFATATAVRFIDSNTLVCSSLLACKIYLIRFDLANGIYNVLDSADTMYGANRAQTDLLDIDGHGNVVTSNCSAGSMSLYRYVRDKIFFVRDLPTNIDDFCHGARFFGTDVVVATMHRVQPGVHFFNVRTMEKLLYIPSAFRAKDVCFLSGRRMILLTTDGAPKPEAQELYFSEAQLIEFDLHNKTYEVLAQHTYERGQFDSGMIHEDRLYAVDCYRGCVLIADADTLEQVGEMGGYNFPHGIDINYGMIALTSYGDNSISIRPF